VEYSESHCSLFLSEVGVTAMHETNDQPLSEYEVIKSRERITKSGKKWTVEVVQNPNATKSLEEVAAEIIYRHYMD